MDGPFLINSSTDSLAFLVVFFFLAYARFMWNRYVKKWPWQNALVFSPHFGYHNLTFCPQKTVLRSSPKKKNYFVLETYSNNGQDKVWSPSFKFQWVKNQTVPKIWELIFSDSIFANNAIQKKGSRLVQHTCTLNELKPAIPYYGNNFRIKKTI